MINKTQTFKMRLSTFLHAKAFYCFFISSLIYSCHVSIQYYVDRDMRCIKYVHAPSMMDCVYRIFFIHSWFLILMYNVVHPNTYWTCILSIIIMVATRNTYAISNPLYFKNASNNNNFVHNSKYTVHRAILAVCFLSPFL